MKKTIFVVVLVLFIFIISGCTGGKFIVHKNLTDSDEGFRYYLPKPYLLVSNTVNANTKTTERTAQIIYLPNFDEKYSVTVLGGASGTFTGNLKLTDGWNLTQIDQQYDTQTAQTINALASLLKLVPSPSTLAESLTKSIKPSGEEAVTLPSFELYEIDLRNRKLIKIEIP